MSLFIYTNMKKIWLLTTLLTIVLLFAGCNKTVQNPEIIDDCVTIDWEDGCAVDIDEPVVEEPTYEILEWTWYMWCIWWCEDWSDEEYVEWYYYRYTNPELGLRITTPSWDWWNYNLGFTTKRETPIFKQINDVIYSLEYDDNPNWSISDAEFIKVYEKDSNISLEDLLKQKYEDCIVKENSFDHWYSSPFVWFKWYYYMVSNSWNSYEKECGRDEWEWMWPMILFLESLDGTKYYKVWMWDTCAPWPCSIFWKVEVL